MTETTVGMSKTTVSSPIDLPVDGGRIIRETFVRRCDVFASLPSTNTYLREAARSPELDHKQMPWLVVATEQTAGRGQGDNRWWSGKGSLTFSLLVEVATFGPNAHADGTLSLAIADAVRAAIAPMIVAEVRVKPPNDVYVGERKIAGVLIETLVVAGGERLAIIGVGLNVNNRREVAPEELKGVVTSLKDEVAKDFSAVSVLIALLWELRTYLKTIRTN